MEIVTSWMEKGIEKGKELGWEEGFKIGWEEGFKLGMEEGFKLGRQKGAASLVLCQLQHCFGNLSQSQQERIQGLSTERLEELCDALLDFNSITDLENWLARKKAAIQLSRLHQKIRRQREDYQWKQAKIIAVTANIIVFEDLNIKGMKSRCKPKKDEATGKYIKNGQAAKAALNQAISDASWYSLRQKTG